MILLAPVEYAGMKVLFNAGWDETLSSSQEAAGDMLLVQLRTVILCQFFVITCDSTLSSLGGLPLYFGASKKDKFGRAPRSLHDPHRTDNTAIDESSTTTKANPPFLATYPTVKMGQMTL